jgi:hypothetical protein
MIRRAISDGLAVVLGVPIAIFLALVTVAYEKLLRGP